ncbi:MAG: NAD(P)-dependent oxidoreductase [Candidatus Marinimicrobia bacterium]|nr:NAD(P)-dependent oxidoreductase [Candidatus Neomarinimicrobiota bacterium]MCF7829993.1 NAD(P)-dependent oxidoreductase [Candidatus Neomarinimicrobiota bacterium]MCF7881853.1 NAD(P)-dependent oxidoreductase [Candidatus Neomarinimicrobiota bacterium]
MNVSLIFGDGHLGRYLVPILVDGGMAVSVIVDEETALPETRHWENVAVIREPYEYQSERWHRVLSELQTDVLVDLAGIDLTGTYTEVRDTVSHLIGCGNIRMYGPPQIIPTPEETQNPPESEEFARRYRDLLGIQGQATHDGVPFTGIILSQIAGPGGVPIDLRGGNNPDTHRAHADGEPVRLPTGCNTLLAPCDVTDAANAIYLAIIKRETATGELFNVGPPYAITWEKIIGIYETAYRRDLIVNTIDWDEFFADHLPEAEANYVFREHSCPDIVKIRTILGYEPQYPPEEALRRGIEWMRKTNIL